MPPIHVPDPEDLAGLQRAAHEHLFVGMFNAEQLAAEGGPIIPVASKGIHFRDLAGHEFVDAIGGMYFRNVGHGREEIAAAVAQQLDQVSMGVFLGGPDRTFKHMFTYTGHPAGAAAGLKNLEIIEREGLVENARVRGLQLKDRMAEMKEKHPIIGDARGAGLIQGLEIVKDRKTKEHFDAKVGVNSRMTAALKKRGIWLRVPAYIVPLAPPLTITADELEHLADAVDESLSEVEKGLRAG